MKIRLLFLVLLLCKAGFSQIEKLEDDHLTEVIRVIKFFQLNNIDSISKIIAFPLDRVYPIPAIKNAKEFKERFSQVFDRNLVKKIAYSQPEEWSEVGWRGITFDNGLIWLNSTEGKIIAVNYQSNIESKLRNDLIDKEKENLYISLREFTSPTYRIQTEKYFIRIDELTGKQYRYACWKTGIKESSKPDLIMTNGLIEYQGSGGNHVITFTNNNYTYRIYRNILEDDSPDITLEVEKDGEIILEEGGILVNQ